MHSRGQVRRAKREAKISFVWESDSNTTNMGDPAGTVRVVGVTTFKSEGELAKHLPEIKRIFAGTGKK